ncbi:hypothetical protein BH20ACT13_BH20ACT13_14790 [soil metagenome]
MLVDSVGTTRHGTQRRETEAMRRACRRPLLGVLGATLSATVLVATAGAAPSATYSDPADDGNETPDISSVTVDDSRPGVMNVRVQVANFDELPSASRIILQFDLDRDATTGVAGDEIVVRYWDDQLFEVLRWDGIRLSPASAEGMTASFAAGAFNFTADRAVLGNTSSFGLIVVSARTQQLDIGRVTGTDYAPATGRSIYSFPGPASFVDPTRDHDAAPDITSISVSDTPGGKIDVRVATSNYPTLPADKVIGVDFDLEGRPPTADDVFVEYLSGPGIVQVNIEEDEILAPSVRPNTATGRYENGVLTLSVDRKELDGAAIVGVGVVTFDLVGRGESEGQAFEGDVEAVDSAPDDLTGALFPYRLANRPPLQLRTTKIVGSPARPRAGRRFTYGVVVRRLDTYSVLRSGSVTCSVRASGTRVPAVGRFVRGRAECSLLVPTKSSSTLRGTVTVRAGGAVVRSTFRAVVR